jgi:hypothetical protein
LVNNTELEVWAGSSTTLTNKILGKSYWTWHADLFGRS